jgi:integrase
VTLESEIRNKPDTIYIYPSFSKGDIVEGEVRKQGNKRKKDEGTVIPLDSELKTALIEYLLTRRPADRHDTAFPLFTKTSCSGQNDRMNKNSLYNMLTKSGSGTGILFEYGWYKIGADTEDNVTLHYFRHYFSDNHKHNHGVHLDHMPMGVIAYIRGDTDDSAVTGGDSQDAALHKNYSHDDWMNWKRNVRKPYLDSIYKFGVYEDTIPAAGE